jgi:hypothetical protein
MLRRLRIPSAPQRSQTTRRQFLETQALTMLAGDFAPLAPPSPPLSGGG